MKPGNRVEDKTLTTGEQRRPRRFLENPDPRKSPPRRGKSWTRSEDDDVREPIQRTGQSGTRNPNGDGEFMRDTEPAYAVEVSSHPVLRRKAAYSR
jgi:hypothetical protein